MPAEPPARRLLVIQAAGLGHALAGQSQALARVLGDRRPHPLQPPFPAVTCTAQAVFRTAADPARHGMVANGWFDREFHRTTFWEQSAALVSGPRIWSSFRARGGRVALLFWQQSLGEDADMVLSPAPIHRHGGGMIDSCYASPPGLYESLARSQGVPFRLCRYWGPLASPASSRWIARATAEVLAGRFATAPDLCLTYLPALDYDLQRFGPDHPRIPRALDALAGDLAILLEACRRHEYDWLLWGDYAIASATAPAQFPNRILREAGLFHTRRIDGCLYPDLHTSRAFACVDHQVAHIYVRDARDIECVRDLLAPCGTLAPHGADPSLDHPRTGELILRAPEGSWLAYPWWTAHREAPDFAAHVDIHNKPGYDPCELFFGWPPGTVGLNPERVRGVHGHNGTGHEACWFSNLVAPGPRTLRELAEAVRRQLETMK